MARSIPEIKKEITDAFLADDILKKKYGFDQARTFSEQFSSVSIESILFYIVASSIWVLENLFDKHQEEVNALINKRAHTLAWYREKAFSFQFGFPLREDICEYDNSDRTEEEVNRSKIITKCSCESVHSVFPTIKVKAVTSNGALTEDQLAAFTSYMKEIADAGVQLSIVSKKPDKLGVSMTIVYDPILMNSRGTLYNDNITNAVRGYINEYLNHLDFNGVFYPNKLEAYLMSCVGIKVANITAYYVKADGDSVAVEGTGKLKCIPSSGAFVFDNSIVDNLKITYLEIGADE